MDKQILWPHAVIVHGPASEWGDARHSRELERLAAYFGKTAVEFDLPGAFYMAGAPFADHEMVVTEDEDMALAHRMEHGAHVYTLTAARREEQQYG